MKLEEIHILWDGDSKIDQSELGQESLKIPTLHNKYYKIMLGEAKLLRVVSDEYKRHFKDKWEYYLGLLDANTLKDRGWEPWSLKILRADVGIYLDSDKPLQELKSKVDFQKDKLEYIEDILKEIHQRGFRIKNAIDWIRFQNGQ